MPKKINKNHIEFVSIAYNDLYGSNIPQNQLREISSYKSFGDKSLVIELIIKKFILDDGDIPSHFGFPEKARVVVDAYEKLYNRTPNAFEKWHDRVNFEQQQYWCRNGLFLDDDCQRIQILTKVKRRSFIKDSPNRRRYFCSTLHITIWTVICCHWCRRADHVVLCLFAGGGGVRVSQICQWHPRTWCHTPLVVENLAGVDVGETWDYPQDKATRTGNTIFQYENENGPTGHYNGHATLMTGVYTDTNLNINANPQYPTVFELYRKHNSPSMSALNAWWCPTLGPYPH